MKKMLLATSLLTLLTLGAASTAQAGPQVHKSTDTAASSRGLWLEFKLGSSAVYSGSMIYFGTSPGFMIGYRAGRLTVGAELGVG